LIISAILVRAKGYEGITALKTGLGMASARGELSLVVAKAGQDVGAISSSVFPILGVVTIVTTFITPYVIKFGSRIRISPSLTSSSDEKRSSPEKSKKRFRFGFRL
jgi:CPA2 family monovalent cation:H+ antiporter-2